MRLSFTEQNFDDKKKFKRSQSVSLLIKKYTIQGEVDSCLLNDINQISIAK